MDLTLYIELPIFSAMTSLKYFLIICLILGVAAGGDNVSANTINLLTDIKVAYLYESAARIDWPLIYYFAAENGCHVDLVTAEAGPVFKQLYQHSDRFNLNSTRFLVNDTSTVLLDSMVSMAFGGELPDIVIFAGEFNGRTMQMFEKYLLDMSTDTSQVFYISKYYRRLNEADSRGVFLKSRQYWDSKYEEITQMAEAVGLGLPVRDREEVYSVYDLVLDRTPVIGQKPAFLSGIDRFKFDRIISKNIESLVQRSALGMNRKNYVTFINNALEAQGDERIGLLMKALLEAKKIRQVYYYQAGQIDTSAAVAKYIENTIASIVDAVFYEARVEYRGNISMVETAEGKKIKFRAEIDNNGFSTVKAGRLEFRPAWSKEPTLIDSGWADLLPNNTLIREYSIDLPPVQEDLNDHSMQFVGHVLYAGNDIEFKYRAGAFERTGFSVEFVPDFLIIQPFPELNLDKLVEPAYLKAIITKPADFAGTVDIDINAPTGVHVGAYDKKLELRTGQAAVEVRIPLAITQSLGIQRQEVIINVSDRGGLLTSDIAFVRQVEFDLPGSLIVAVLADNSGLLEDILMQSDAAYKSLTDRYVKTRELDYYDVVIIGSGTIDDPQVQPLLKDKLKSYLETGGTAVVFSRSGQWGENMLPVSIVAGGTGTTGRGLQTKTANHPFFKGKYTINVPDLLKRAAENYESHPAVVFPCERIIDAAEGSTVLSETKIGRGTLIYCGLPLLEMIRNLDPDAIKLFANLLLYSKK
ncbi:MAG: hypothetical protein AB1746_12650 [Candidatus Zixiibacteriota bacterium]